MNKASIIKKSTIDYIENIIKWIGILFAISFFVFFFYNSIIHLILYTTYDAFELNFESFFNIITEIRNLEAIVFSTMQGIFTTLICLALGIPLSYILKKFKFPGKKIFLYGFTIPFILPASVLVFGFNLSYGKNGWFVHILEFLFKIDSNNYNIYGSFHAIMIVHVIANIAIIIWIGGLAWENLNYEQILIAKTLGSSKLKIFHKIIFPQIKPYFLSASILIFAYSFNSFALVLTLGGINLESLEVRIFKEAIYNFDFQESLILTITQLILNILIILIYLKLEKKGFSISSKDLTSLEQKKLFHKPFRYKTLVFSIGMMIFLVLSSIFVFSPIFSVIFASFKPFSQTDSAFSGYQYFFSRSSYFSDNITTLQLLWNTLWLAGVSILITLLLSFSIFLLFRSKFFLKSNRINQFTLNLIKLILTLPLARATITIVIGLFVQFQDLDFFVHGHNRWLLVIITQILLSVPITTRILMDSYQHVNLEYIEVSRVMGASRIRTFIQIELPHLKRGIVLGIFFTLIISVGEFSSTLFITQNEYPTLASGIFLMIRSTNVQITASIAVILIVLAIFLFIIVEINHNAKFQKTISKRGVKKKNAEDQ